MPDLRFRSLRDLILSVRGCVGLYLADELSGTVARDQTFTNTGAWTGTPTRGQNTITPGDPLPATKYNNAGNYILCKSGFILGAQTNSSVLTASRAPVGTTAGASGMSIYVERGSAGNAIWKLEWSAGTPRVRFTHRDDAGSLTQTLGTSTASLGDGRNHLLGVTKAGTAIRHFRDGALDGTASLSGTDTLTAATAESRIGSDKGDAAAFFTESLGFVALFNRTLTDNEMFHLSRFALGAV